VVSVDSGPVIEATGNATLMVRLIRESWAWSVDPRSSGHRTTRQDIEQAIEAGGSAIVARIDEVPVGCVLAVPFGDGQSVDVRKLAVLASHRSQGVGAALLDEVVRFARGLRTDRLVLAVSAYQPTLVRFYARLGFVVSLDEVYEAASPTSPPPIVMTRSLVGPAAVDPLADAVRALTSGGLVVLPTETVYGLGANARDPLALRRVFATKGRPADHPLIVHLASAVQLDDWAIDIPPDARTVAATCWPGPLTMVLRRHPSVPDEVTGGRDTVALRVPSHPTALALLGMFDDGIAAPSANRFGRVSPTTAAHVRADLGDLLVDGLDVVLDGGPSQVGVESTIIELIGDAPQLLRPGGLPVERVEEVLGRPVQRVATGPSRAPGMLASHYAPSAIVRVVTLDSIDSAFHGSGPFGFLGPQSIALPSDVHRLRSPDPYNGDALAPLLYRSLRLADELDLGTLVIVAPDGDGLGPAVRDRLARAAYRH
jgi:L-threonylcarbamoyladenylate synthase